MNTPAFLANLHKHGISHKLNNIFHLYVAEEKSEIPDNIQVLAQQRRQAKIAKDRATADALRDQLAQLGREMNDGKD